MNQKRPTNKKENNMGDFKKWVKNHKVAIGAILTSIVGIVVWGLLPEKEEPVKEEWIPPVKKNWYMESDD